MQLYAEALRTHRTELDSLNVFPVPDGDTGSNLVRTQERVERALEASGSSGAADAPADGPLAALGASISAAALLGARGNSGVILAQTLRGFCETLPDRTEADADEVAAALRRASDQARRAVARPLEGTALSVLSAAADAAEGAAAAAGDCEDVARAALAEAREALARTPQQLPELAAAGVVDAGGLGVVLLLDAITAAVSGGPLSEPVGPGGPMRSAGTATVASERLPRLEFAFEVQYLLEAPDHAVSGLREQLMTIGGSVAVVGGDGLFNVHVHTDEPGAAVDVANDVGRPREIAISHLGEQARSCLGGEARGVQVAEAIPACGLVAVVAGTDLIRTFASLGAVVVPGGPGSPPPVEEILDAIRSAAAAGVAVLPNHADAHPAAAEAAAASDTPVQVVPATSVPAGLAAAAAYNASVDLEENARAMTAAAAACRSVTVVRAVGEERSALGAVPAESWVGMTGGEIVVTGQSAEQASVALIGWLASPSNGEAGPGIPVELITLIVGAEADPSATPALTTAMCAAFPGTQVDVLDGGQPVEAYVIGVE